MKVYKMPEIKPIIEGVTKRSDVPGKMEYKEISEVAQSASEANEQPSDSGSRGKE